VGDGFVGRRAGLGVGRAGDGVLIGPTEKACLLLPAEHLARRSVTDIVLLALRRATVPGSRHMKAQKVKLVNYLLSELS